MNLATCHVDDTAAYVHAQIYTEVLVKMLHGFATPGNTYKLKQSPYGLKQRSPHNVFQHVESKIEAVGPKSQEQVNPYLFISERVIVLVYLNDTLFHSPHKEWIDEKIERIEEQDLKLAIEDSVAEFLGLRIKRNKKDGTIKLTQIGLKRQIIKALLIQELL